MVTLQDIRVHNLISNTPFFIIFISIFLLYVDFKILDKKRVSQFMAGVLIKIFCIPMLVYAPYLFFMTLGTEQYILYNILNLTGYLYWFVGFSGFLIFLMYLVETVFSKFMLVDIYMDGFKVRWKGIL